MMRTPPAALLAIAFLWTSSPGPLLAQDRADRQPTAPVTVFQDTPDARETREQLQRLLRNYPPALGEVLQRDPTLLSRTDYLAPYPALVAFLAQHPEVARNPSFFFGEFHYYEPDPRRRAEEMMTVILGGFAGASAFVAFLSLIVWLVRAMIDHRRWLRLSRVQTEVHTKLMDRFTSNEDLLAYIQSPPGRRFLESAPIPIDGEPRPTSAPVGRILWSLQAGIVLFALGLGFWFAQKNVFPEAAEGFYVLGVVATALGAGFTASAVASYFISSRLGLMTAPKSSVDA